MRAQRGFAVILILGAVFLSIILVILSAVYLIRVSSNKLTQKPSDKVASTSAKVRASGEGLGNLVASSSSEYRYGSPNPVSSDFGFDGQTSVPEGFSRFSGERLKFAYPKNLKVRSQDSDLVSLEDNLGRLVLDVRSFNPGGGEASYCQSNYSDYTRCETNYINFIPVIADFGFENGMEAIFQVNGNFSVEVVFYSGKSESEKQLFRQILETFKFGQ